MRRCLRQRLAGTSPPWQPIGSAAAARGDSAGAAPARAVGWAVAGAPAGRRSVWGESLDRSEAHKLDSFYNTTVERCAPPARPMLPAACATAPGTGRRIQRSSGWPWRMWPLVARRCVRGLWVKEPCYLCEADGAGRSEQRVGTKLGRRPPARVGTPTPPLSLPPPPHAASRSCP
jgi:hypothetical protein